MVAMVVLYAMIVLGLLEFSRARQANWSTAGKGVFWLAGLVLGLVISYNVAWLATTLLRGLWGGYG